MTEMVERVARAIHDRMLKNLRAAELPDWDELGDAGVSGEVIKDEVRAMARDAIAGMRQPTEAMRRIGTANVDRRALAEDTAALVWDSMMAEALKEPPA